MKTNDFKEKLNGFLKGKGFYIVLALCALTVATVGFLSIRNALDIVGSNDNGNSDSTENANVTNNGTVTDNSGENISHIETDNKSTEKENTEKSTETLNQKKPAADSKKDYIMPVSGNTIVKFSSQTPLYSKTLEDWRVHLGIDISAAEATKVKASNDGIVDDIIQDDLLGVIVVIKHNDGLKTRYANLAANPSVKKGQTVKQGDTIGKVGKTAIVEILDDSHLHFEVIKDGKNADPSTIIKK